MAAGGQSGGGMGYSIPVSISDAQTSASPIDYAAGTYFIFSSPNTSLGDTRQQANPNNPATATSSAALGGNATSSTAGSGVGSTGTGLGSGALGTGGIGSNSNTLILALGAISILLTLYSLYKSSHH